MEHIVGTSKKGKSKVLEALVAQLIAQGKPVIVIDPAGSLVKKIQSGSPDPEEQG